MQKGDAKGTLYLIPTPLGEEGGLGALTASGIELVRSLRHFATENARTARRFLSALGMPCPIQELHIYPFDRRATIEDAAEVMEAVSAGHSVGVLSEAGAPGIADPGALLVGEAHRRRIEVVPLVGPSSILLALMGSGLSGQQFTFHGYLPIEAKARNEAIARMEREVMQCGSTHLFIETPYRNDKLLEVLLTKLRPATALCIARGIHCPNQLLCTQSVAEWQKNRPQLGKTPTIFAIGAMRNKPA